VETGDIPVRLIGIGNYSLDVEVFAYVTTSDYDVFLGVQQELLIKMLQAVERVGAALAVPLLENSHAQEFASASRPVVSVPPPVDDRLHERRYLGSNS
jgi:hypothetical protein